MACKDPFDGFSNGIQMILLDAGGWDSKDMTPRISSDWNGHCFDQASSRTPVSNTDLEKITQVFVVVCLEIHAKGLNREAFSAGFDLIFEF